MKILIIDGQGGGMGRTLVELIKTALPGQEITAIGTNTIATSAMLRAGADNCATGENPVIRAARDADIIAGPIGIIAADSLLGEVTPAIATAVGSSAAQKVLVPVARCNLSVAGLEQMPTGDYVRRAAEIIANLVEQG